MNRSHRRRIARRQAHARRADARHAQVVALPVRKASFIARLLGRAA